MKLNIIILAAIATLTGCVSITPRAQRIQLHPANSVAIQSCQKIGPVTARATAANQWTYDDVNEQARNNLRDAVAEQYGDRADSVVLLNIETHTNGSVASGIAYKCF
jgi:hypothetical protein